MKSTFSLPLHLIAGLALLLVSATLFHTIASAWGPGATLALRDVQLAHWLHARAAEPWTSLMLAVTHLHSVAGIAMLTLLLAWRMWQRQQHYWLLTLMLCVPPGMLLNMLLKHLYQRQRPSFDDPLVSLATYSFPSGHTLTATVFYGVLACYLYMQSCGALRRSAIVLGAALMVALVAFSRLYLGAHYLSDVLGAITEGLAWLAICVTGVSHLRRRRQAP